MTSAEPDRPGSAGPEDDEQPAICSSKGCTAVAVWDLLWNNPKLHPPERRKIWLACDDHRTSLGDFLAARRFLREVALHGAERTDTPGV